jgi:hypothetical protein
MMRCSAGRAWTRRPGGDILNLHHGHAQTIGVQATASYSIDPKYAEAPQLRAPDPFTLTLEFIV